MRYTETDGEKGEREEREWVERYEREVMERKENERARETKKLESEKDCYLLTREQQRGRERWKNRQREMRER